MQIEQPQPETMQTTQKLNWKKILLLCLTSGVFGVLFVAFTLIVRADLTDSFDFNMTVRIQDNTPVSIDTFLMNFTVLAKFQTMLAILVIGLIAWRKWWGLVSMLALFFLAHVTEIIGKGFLEHNPPPFMFYRHPTEFIFPELHTFDHSSYPSGHSMRIVYVVITFGYLVWVNKKLSLWAKLAILGVFAGIVAITLFSRVSLGEHWSTDVIGGALLGAAFGVLGLLFL